jgi:SPP1 family predicted phage head-tail adaptor
MATKWTPRGEMRHHITIQQIATTVTDSGETTGTASTFCQTWAKIEPLGGKEVWLARAQQDTTTHRIRMPYVSGITPKMQAVLGTRTFKFGSVNDLDELRREIEVMATEVLE